MSDQMSKEDMVKEAVEEAKAKAAEAETAGTDQEDTVFEPYLAIIGISDWDIVQDFISE